MHSAHLAALQEAKVTLDAAVVKVSLQQDARLSLVSFATGPVQLVDFSQKSHKPLPYLTIGQLERQSVQLPIT